MIAHQPFIHACTIISFTYHPFRLSLVLVEEVERFDTEHPGNANNSNNHQNNMNIALKESRETQMYVTVLHVST